MARRVATSLLSALLLAALAVVPAHASHTQSMTFEARDLLNPATRESAFGQIAGLGAHRVRVILYWKDVAPSPTATKKPSFDATDPAAYDWSKYDAAIDEAADRGWPVLLTVTGPVPYWATLARRDALTRPSPAEFERFMTAVAKHYGDKVAQFAIWNEPNDPHFLKPQYFKGQVASASWYRKLFVAGLAGLKAGGLANPSVLFGETSPIGGATTVRPLTFLRKALCLSTTYKRDPSCGKLAMAGYAHHAYTRPAGPYFVPENKDDVTIGAISRLVTALDKAAKAGAIAKSMPIYLTEFGIQSLPDPIVGVSQQKQAEFLALSERLAWNQPRVKGFSQYLLRDDDPGTGSDRYGGFESGLRFADGRAKISYRSFPVPLVALRTSTTKVSLWGLARPAGRQTKVTVLAGRGSSFTRYATYTTDAHGYFTKSVPYTKNREYRLRWTSPEGKVYTGPPIRVYTRP
ncbi:MAG TPA: hypothetical protein VFB41_00225 [Solirubrobacteraceae bacterium]|nr:hypothetical protein [Solirubrobacteraceae bacterium]